MQFLHAAMECRDVFPGGVLVPQTFGGMANWNPHVHALVTDTCRDRRGNTYPYVRSVNTSIGSLADLSQLFG